MTCDNQPIADMLVPYVEGTLVEAERLRRAAVGTGSGAKSRRQHASVNQR